MFASPRTQPGTHSHRDHGARREPADALRESGRKPPLFVRAGRVSCGHNAGQMLSETQVRFAGKTVGVRTECAKKTVYFLLGLVLPGGVRYRQIYRVLLGLHLLLLPFGLGCLADPDTQIAARTLPVPRIDSPAKVFREKGKSRVFRKLSGVNSTFVPYGIPGSQD